MAYITVPWLIIYSVMCLVVPSAFLAGITPIGATSAEQIITSDIRNTILKFSRGMVCPLISKSSATDVFKAIIMLLVYIASRIYSINPPGDENAGEFYADHGGHEAFKEEEDRLKTEQAKISPLFCFGLLVFLVVIVGFTAEWLVHSIEAVRERVKIQEE